MPSNRLAAKIAHPAFTPPDTRVRVRLFQMPAASVMTAPALVQRHGGAGDAATDIGSR
jgi:hypothetical protein